jgi:hypothetical protein
MSIAPFLRRFHHHADLSSLGVSTFRALGICVKATWDISEEGAGSSFATSCYGEHDRGYVGRCCFGVTDSLSA